MSKTFSKDELRAKAQEVLKQHPTTKEVYATVDGQIFFMKNRAELHSKDKIYTFGRDPEGKAEGSDSDKLTKATEIVKFIEEATTLEAILPYETDTRATVVAAYKAKKDELAKGTSSNPQE